MFDFDREIRNWRKTIEQRLPRQSDCIAELESHLRDAYQKYLEQSATPEVAWRQSIKDLGDPEAIAAEFKKLPSPRLFSWLSVRVAVAIYGVLALLTTTMTSRALFVRHDALLAVHVWSITLGYLAILAFGLFSSWLVLCRACRGWSEPENALYLKATRSVMIAAVILNTCGVCLGGIWIRNHERQFWIFDFRELGGLAVVVSNILTVLITIRFPNTPRAMQISLMNVAIVLAAWILPAFWENVNEYGNHGTFFGIATGSFAVIAILGGLTLVEPGQLRLARHQPS